MAVVEKVQEKNAGHDMAIVVEPWNVDAHANILALYMTYVVPIAVCTHVL